MEKLTGSQKRYLRGMAHHLDPVVMVGKNGVTKNVLNMTDSALKSHELIKTKKRILLKRFPVKPKVKS